MIIMITLGIGIFLGFNMEWYTIEYDTSRFFADTNYADFRLYDQNGFTVDDLEKIASIDGVKAATRFLSVNLDLKGKTNKSLALDVSENYTVSTFVVMSGEEYDENGDGFWLSDKFAATNDYKIGDELILEFQGMDISGKIVGLIKSGEHMICVADKNQLMPDYNTFGYAYISPAKLKKLVRQKLDDTCAEIKKSGLSGKLIDEKIEELMSEDAADEVTDMLFGQIDLLSDMDKESLEDAVGDKLGRTIMVTPKTDHVVYKEAMGESEEGKTMGSVLPVLFLAIAILTMVTTMHRIATKEKIQIGTLKALGFKNRRILRHYTSYGLFIGLVGTALGMGLGYLVCRSVMSENGMMGTYFDMPDWSPATPLFCYPVMLGTIILLTLISFLSVHRQLRGTAAEALRPYTPKKMRKLVWERTKLWDKLRFGTKWNIRDLSRHKSRSFMTLFGIVGCMVLMVAGLECVIQWLASLIFLITIFQTTLQRSILSIMPTAKKQRHLPQSFTATGKALQG